MNRNKLVAAIIGIALYLGPFYYLFIRNNGSEIVDTGKEMLIGVSWIVGMIIAFYFAVNQPLQAKKPGAVQHARKEDQRKAA
jgi:hypothetical protein